MKIKMGVKTEISNDEVLLTNTLLKSFAEIKKFGATPELIKMSAKTYWRLEAENCPHLSISNRKDTLTVAFQNVAIELNEKYGDIIEVIGSKEV